MNVAFAQIYPRVLRKGMSLLVVGSVALDSVRSHYGEVKDALGGAATYFAVSASLFTSVRLVGVVGKDFPHSYLEFLKACKIDLSCLEIKEGKTFRWIGKYGEDNRAITLDTQLNVFEDFSPKLPEEFRDTEYVFLANISPRLQYDVLKQLNNPRFVALDTMDFWIENARDDLLKVLREVNAIIINEEEARILCNERNLIRCAKILKCFGPEFVIIKKGEHGVLLFSKDSYFFCPSYPIEEVFDPTGAGDSLAGGFMGYLASKESLEEDELRKGIIYGTVIASFTIQDFSLNRLRDLTIEDVEQRYKELKEITRF